MPQTIHRGIKSLIDEANAEIETLSAADAIKAAANEDVVIVDFGAAGIRRIPAGTRGFSRL